MSSLNRRAFVLFVAFCACADFIGIKDVFLLTDGGADADAAPASPTPATIYGDKLVLWLDADDSQSIVLDDAGVTRVTTWKDRSSYANNAAVIYSPFGGDPAITVSNFAIHGHAAMKMSGTSNLTGLFDVADSISLEWGTDDFIITIVAAYSNTPSLDEYSGRAQFWGKADTTTPAYWGTTLQGNAYDAPQADGGVGGPDSVIFGGIATFTQGPNVGAWTATDGWNDGTFHVFTVRKDTAGASIAVRADGQETPSTEPVDASTSVSAIGHDLQIGGYSSGTTCCFAPLRGFLAEVIAARKTHGTSAELAALATYISEKYALQL